MEQECVTKRYNENFIEVLEQLASIMVKKGEAFRANAYQKAQETIMCYNNDITTIDQLKGLPGIGTTIMDKLNEYIETGTLRVIELEKINPINILIDIYGVGPKKARDLVDSGIKTIDELRTRQDELLNETQKIGLHYYEDIQMRIPREEIEKYNHLFNIAFKNANSGQDGQMEIVGSYRRGAKSSGDIDLIITSTTGTVYKNFIAELLKQKIIIEVLSTGPSKTLVITRLPGMNVARRVDFLYAPPDEFAFAILYFTGSKIFNTVMRQHALNKGYTFNEHGIYKLDNKQKGEKVDKHFTCEKDIFDFLGLQFKTPIERTDGRSVVAYTEVGGCVQKSAIVSPTSSSDEIFIIPIKKNKTVKKRAPIPASGDTQALNIVSNFKHNGISILETLNEQQLGNIVTVANAKYYNEEPIMTDNQFDIVKEYIQHRFPNNYTNFEVGATVEKNKALLPYEMASMDKIKPDTNAITNWIAKYAGPYIISCKLDGVSGLYTTEGSTPKLYTRGNGTIGQDISYLLPFLKLPKIKGIAIRGEFLIRKDVFKTKYASTFANPRNTVAGLINRKNLNESIVDLQFVAYEVIMPEKMPIEQMELLKTLNIQSVHHIISDTVTNDMLSNMLITLRHDSIYEIDGLIVTNNKLYPRKSGNPEHSFAFKMVLTDQLAEAKVVDVIWTPSKDGYLKPRVQIEPIHLGGVIIEYATGFNASFIKDNNIGIGATIQIIRSGDVIPHIKSVTVPAPPKMPECMYKWNDTCVDIMLENISEDPIVKEKNITGFFRGIGVDGLSSGNISRLIKTGYDTVPDIIQMLEKDFLKVDGFKGKMANKIYTGIQQKIKEASIVSLMSASNIFGRGFSDKKMELILNEMPTILVLTSYSKEATIVAVSEIKGMARKTAESFVDKIEAFTEFLDKCGLKYKLYETIVQQPIDTTNALYNKHIVLTGTRDATIVEFLKKVGAIQSTSVTKNTFMVVAKDKDDDTGKAEEARKLNIKILSITEFIHTFM
jgi:DNA ligase (NAD+)